MGSPPFCSAQIWQEALVRELVRAETESTSPAADPLQLPGFELVVSAHNKSRDNVLQMKYTQEQYSSQLCDS